MRSSDSFMVIGITVLLIVMMNHGRGQEVCGVESREVW